MTDIPIIFSAPMVRALLAGRKTQTRRLAWGECRRCNNTGYIGFDDVHQGHIQCPKCREQQVPSSWQRVKPGDRLWVRETFWGCDFHETGDLPIVVYAERHHGKTYDHPGNVMIAAPKFGHIPAIHMPRKASRLTLVVTATKVERLTAISHDDAVAEGVGIFPASMSAQKRFRELWCSLHGADSWDANPDVVAPTFTVHKSNIDAMERAA